MSAWTCRQLSERSPKRSFHLVFESHDGTAYVPIPERSTSLRVTSTPPVVDSQKRLTPNGRLEKRTLVDGVEMSAFCQKRTFCSAKKMPLFDPLAVEAAGCGRVQVALDIERPKDRLLFAVGRNQVYSAFSAWRRAVAVCRYGPRATLPTSARADR